MSILKGRTGLRTKIAAVGATAAVAAGAAWVVTAVDGTNASASTADTSSATTAAHHKHHGRDGLLGRTDHATLQVKRHGQWVTIDLDRGKVASVDATSITLDRPDGQDVTLALNSTTKYKGVPSSAATVATGRRATVISENGAALRVVEANKPAGTKK